MDIYQQKSFFLIIIYNIFIMYYKTKHNIIICDNLYYCIYDKKTIYVNTINNTFREHTLFNQIKWKYKYKQLKYIINKFYPNKFLNLNSKYRASQYLLDVQKNEYNRVLALVINFLKLKLPTDLIIIIIKNCKTSKYSKYYIL